MNKKNKNAKVIYLPHGGGPMPLLGDKGHKELINFFKTIPEKLGKPDAIVVISAHWEEPRVTVTTGKTPEMIYDYSGFPKETYEIKYSCSGNPELAEQIFNILNESGIEAVKDSKRGYDHGLYVPLMLMYPEAKIPSIQVSLNKNLDPETHIRIGEALSELRDKNILFIGSGMSFHNMRWFFSESEEGNKQAVAFDTWLKSTLSDADLSIDDKAKKLINWKEAPGGKFSHPREEHLIPIHVCFGIAKNINQNAEIVFNEEVLGKKVSAFLWE